jgi:hypothetical protein
MRGRLIQKFLCSLRRLDTKATSEVVGGGFDPEFGEEKIVEDASQLGTSSRREHDAVDIPCQVDRRNWGQDVMTGGGHDAETEIYLTFHFSDLERMGLVHLSGDLIGTPMVGAGDRMEKLKDYAGNTVQTFPDPPGMFVVGAEQAGFGLNTFGTPKRNLLIVTFRPERQGRHG